MVVTVSGCAQTKGIYDGQVLLQKNIIKGDRGTISKSDLYTQIKHKPNRRVLFLKGHLWVNHFGSKLGWDKVGEKPVLLDSAAIDYSAQNLQRYFVKKGYFNGAVTTEIKDGGRNRILGIDRKTVVYHVKAKAPFVVSKVVYHVDGMDIQNLLDSTRAGAEIASGDIVDFDKLTRERSRISQLLRNKGYYQFNPNYITYVLDTALERNRVQVDLTISKPEARDHVKQTIDKVFVVFETGQQIKDTIHDLAQGIEFIMNGMDITHAVIANNILLKSGQYYSHKNLETTYKRLINLSLFTNVGVDVQENTTDSTLLNIVVRLKPAPKFDFVWQPQIITTEQRFNNSQSSRNYGLANEFSLKNKNVFHNGEEFDINFRTALETQFTSDSNAAFSTFIQEVNTELRVPQLLFLRDKGNQLKVSSVRTNISASYLFETNPFYRRNFFPLSYTYRISDDRFGLNYSPLIISFNQAQYNEGIFDQASPAYIATLDRIFTNNLITSQQIGGYFTNREKGSRKYWTIYSNALEIAGFWLPLVTDYGRKFGVNHSTFVRSDVDLRYHVISRNNNEFVFRWFGGIGLPVWVNSVLPFERRFAGGGSNYLRGWRLRTVGPGSFSAPNNLQLTRTGEISLLGNAEYRFNVIKSSVDVNGALFLDIGNVWNIRPDTLFPNGEFQFSRFTQELATNAGLGVRIDFDFLLLRADWGVPLWDPNFPLSERAVIRGAFRDAWIFKRPVWNIAVGYPF